MRRRPSNKGDIAFDPRPHPLEWVMCGQPKSMTNTTAKAQLLDLPIERLKGCKGIYANRQNLMPRVMHMPDLEVRNHINRLRASHLPGTRGPMTRECNS